MAKKSECEMQAIGEAPHDMRDAIACEQGHTYCLECLGAHALQCERCGGLACCCCPGNGEGRCPECALLGRPPQSLCGPCFEVVRFRCCKKAGRTLARCDYHHWHASFCACGSDVCATCRRLGRCACGDLLVVLLGNHTGPASNSKVAAPKPSGGAALASPPPRAPPKWARSQPEDERSGFQSPRFRPVRPTAGAPVPIDIDCL